MATLTEKLSYHEAGHAVIARVLRVEVVSVNIFRVVTKPASREADAATLANALENHALVSLAGPQASIAFFPQTDQARACKNEWAKDYEDTKQFVVQSIIAREEGSITEGRTLDENEAAEAQRVLERLRGTVFDLVNENRGAIRHVARELRINPLIKQDKLDELIAEAPANRHHGPPPGGLLLLVPPISK